MAQQYYKNSITREEVESRFVTEGYEKLGCRIEETENYYFILYETECLDGENVCIDENKLIQNWKIFRSKSAAEEAKKYLDSGEALYELEEGKHIEATGENIGKLSAYALGFITGAIAPEGVVYWNTKEDETISLTCEQLTQALMGLGAVQSEVWNVKYPAYLEIINNLNNLDALIKFKFDYASFIPAEEQSSNAVQEGESDSPSNISESEE